MFTTCGYYTRCRLFLFLRKLGGHRQQRISLGYAILVVQIDEVPNPVDPAGPGSAQQGPARGAPPSPAPSSPGFEVVTGEHGCSSTKGSRGASEDFEDDGGTALALSFDFSYGNEGSDDDCFLPMATPNEGSGSEGDDAGFCGPFTDSKSGC